MRAATLRPSGIAIARDAMRALCEALDLPTPPEARPGADLLVRLQHDLPLPAAGTLLRAADGWVHPGPPTVWDMFTALAVSLGAPAPRDGQRLPDVSALPAGLIDAEAGEWRLPAVAVRARPVAPEPLVPPAGPIDVKDARVLVLGTAWAVPLTGFVLAQLGARVTRLENPRREDPFPLRDSLARGQARVAIDFDERDGHDAFVELLGAADLLVDGNTPRVLANLGLDDVALRDFAPTLSVVRVSAFLDEDRPGYGLAAECRGGWAARFDPPRLARTSVADPVGGLRAAVVAVDALAEPGTRARLSLEGAAGHLLELEASRG
jgi:hypothetical protein